MVTKETVSHLKLVSLFWCLTALNLGPATSFCLLYIHSLLPFSHLACTHFAYCITHLIIHRNLFQFLSIIAFFPVHSKFINQRVNSWPVLQSPTGPQFADYNPSPLFVCQHILMFVSLSPSHPQKICNIHNPGHNILALFNNLGDVLIPTSKTMLDI